MKFKSKNLYIFYIFPFVAWLGLIHFSSSQSYEDQNVQPLMEGFKLDWVYSLFSWVSFRYGESVVSLETRSPEAFIEFFLRKGAHVVAFAVLAILAFRLIQQFLPNIYYTAVISWLFVTLYAAIDEYRQHFHPNRSGMIEDVILDSAGALLGLGVILVWKKSKINLNFTINDKNHE